MDEATKELLESLVAGTTATNTAIKELTEALKPVAKVEDEAEESAVDPLAVAKALADSELSESGRERVFELHKATGKDVSELIESEKAYEASFKKSVEESAGTEEEADESAGSEGEEAEESYVPKAWRVSK